MQAIQHTNVIQLKHVEWDCTYTKKNGLRIPVILVVLELATGGELFDFLAFTGPFEEAIARTYFQQLIAGIAHCHSKGIAHRVRHTNTAEARGRGKQKGSLRVFSRFFSSLSSLPFGRLTFSFL